MNTFTSSVRRLQNAVGTLFRETPVKFFVIVAAVFGLIFIAITPPLQGADETVHFFRAYQVAEFDFVADKSGDAVGGNLPLSMGRTVETIAPNEVTFYPNLKYDGERTIAAAALDVEKGDKFYEFSGGATYSPVAYLGAAPGILVSRIIDTSSIISLYAGRLGNLLFWIMAVACSIAMIPRRKWVIVLIGLLPMSIFQASTINGDAVTTGSLLLLVTMILRLREAKAIRTRDILALAAIGAAMVLSKQVMFIFLPLLLLLKKETFMSARASLLVKFGLIIFPLVCYGAWAVVSQAVSNVGPAVNGQDPSGQFQFILHNPHSFINVMWNTYFYTWGDNITRSLIGTFGWSDAPLSELIVSIGYIGLALIALGTYGVRQRLLLSRNEKLLVAGVALLYWLAVSTSLYMYYSPVGYKIIYGLQGRYFIPLLAVLLPLVASTKIKIEQKTYQRLAVALPLFLLVASTITIYVRYYINNV